MSLSARILRSVARSLYEEAQGQDLKHDADVYIDAADALYDAADLAEELNA